MAFSVKTQQFLWDLSFNNERPWFQANREVFEETVNTPFKDLANRTFEELSKRFPLDGLSCTSPVSTGMQGAFTEEDPTRTTCGFP